MLERIGPFQVLRELGRGGMGVVYLARDTRLDREVAIKALPEHLATDPARLERFEREAKTLAGLSHANVAGIYGVEEQDGAKYLVLEYVDGETLADRLDRGALPVDEAIEYAVQIAAGIEAAHEAGVIHRDLKPANIKITSDGVAKVLDFGLARAEAAGSSTGGLDSPTMTTPQPQHSPTIEGAILGTAAYMSPEQARGRRVDKRTDIWSFGIVLYEMLVGASPFHGETATDSIGAVLHKNLDLDRLPVDTPAHVRRVLDRCVERDKSLRYRDIGDVRVELMRAGEPEESTPATGSGRAWIALAAALALTTITGWGLAWWGRAEGPPAVRKLDVMTESENRPLGKYPSISPDGNRLAYHVDGVIHVRDLASFESRALTKTQDAKSLFWSPDGEWIGYVTDTAVHKVGLRGGGAIKIANVNSADGGGWTTDDRIVVATDKELLAIPARGGEPRKLAGLEGERIAHYHDASVMIGTNVALVPEHHSATQWAIVAHDGQRRVVVVEFEGMNLSTPVYSPTGHVLYTRSADESNLWAVGFDPARMEVTGEPFLVMSNTRHPSVSLDGTLVVRRGTSGESNGEFVWVSRDGDLTSTGIVMSNIKEVIPSPDESRIAYSTGTRGSQDVWVYDLARGSSSRLTFYEGWVTPEAWSPDGRELALTHFMATADVNADNFVQTQFYAADGSGPAREPLDMVSNGFDAEWNRMAGTRWRGSDEDSILFEVRLDDPSNVIELNKPPSLDGMPHVSPDFSLSAFYVRESGQDEIFVTRYPDGDGRWQITSDGGWEIRWSADGNTLYYRAGSENAIFAVDVTREPSPTFGLPVKILDAEALGLDLGAGWWPTQDDQRFFAVKEIVNEDPVPAKISVITNWFEEFREP